jgi:signal peptidase II
MPRWARFAVLTVVNGVVAAGVAWVVALERRISLPAFMACALLLAGAMGNFIDRVRWDGLVIDFLNLGVGRLRTGIFNVADVSIMAGAAILLLESLARGTPTDPGPRPHSQSTA